MRTVLALVLLAAPRGPACPVCFGQNNTPMGNAVKAGVILMLVLVGLVLTGFGAFIVQLNRRARVAEESDQKGNRLMLELLGLLPQASTHAGEIDHMIVIVHWLMLVLFVGWGAFFVFVLFRFRKGANPKASYTGAKGKLAKGLEIGVAIVEVILLVFLRDSGLGDARRGFPSENEATVVRVTGKQFEWICTIPVLTADSAAAKSPGSRPTIRSARSAPTPTPRTTSSPPTSSISLSTGLSSCSSPASTPFTASGCSRCG